MRRDRERDEEGERERDEERERERCGGEANKGAIVCIIVLVKVKHYRVLE